MNKLNIIIPHAGESWGVCRKFFDMLRLQLAADFSQARLLIIHDNCAVWPDKYLWDLPVKAEQHQVFRRGGRVILDGGWDPTDCRQAGVSAARNAGIEKADAEWVMFCDCDDMFATVWALHSILDALNQPAADRNDLLWTKFYIEQSRGRQVTGMNWVFIHGKIWRLDFLIRQGLRFHEGLYYAEDSAFCATADMVIDHGRIGEIQCDAVPYVWVWNRESVTSREENQLRNVLGLYDRHVVVAEEYRRRGLPDMAAATAARAVWDGFYQCRREDLTGEQLQKVEEKVARYFLRYEGEIRRVPEELMAKIRAASRKEAAGKRLPTPPEDGFGPWAEHLKQKYGGGNNV